MRISKEEVQILIDKWGVGDITSYEKSTKGESNHNWIVKTTHGKFILRRAPDFRKLKDLKFELFYLTKLNEDKFPYKVPVPIKTNRGQDIIKYKKGNWWLYRYIEGKIIEPISIQLIPELARMIALYHLFLKKNMLSNGKSETEAFDKTTTIKDLKKLYAKTQRMVHKEAKHKIFLAECVKLMPLLESLKSDYYKKLPQYPLHRDLNPENILWEGNKISGIIDFENVGTMNDNFITDIAIAIMFATTTEKEHKLDLNKTRKFLEVYQKYRRLSKQEIELIPDIIMAGFIGAFSWQYWLQLNDPERAQLHRLKLYSNAAQWHYLNRDKIIKALNEIK